MHIIKLDATDSTNLYLKNLLLSRPLDDFTVVVSKEQTKGRGQMGTQWQSKPGKNLTFSVLKKFNGFFIQHQFHLNIIVSLALCTTLNTLKIPDLYIKWPNDILSGRLKICGILVENILKGQQIRASIIGIGLNVNQTDFLNLLNVSSLKLLLGKNFNLEDLLSKLLENLNYFFVLLESGKIEELKKLYLDSLFMKDEKANFQDFNGNSFSGTIKGISQNGRLLIRMQDGIIKEFDTKEVKLLY